MNNPYLPYLARIEHIRQETPDTKTFQAVILDENAHRNFNYKPGQFQMISVFGVGEAPFCLTCSPTRREYIEFSVKKMGVVTTALHNMREGDIVGIRGPFGNHFPYEEMQGKNIIFIGGGIGLAPLRSLIQFCIDNRDKYGDLTIIYGARTSDDLCFKEELKEWEKAERTRVYLTIDRQDGKWDGHIGFVPPYVMEISPSPDNAYAVTCGPPIMIKFTIENLLKLGFPPERIITTLEMRMKCGIGKCGRCNVGSKYVCLDGPVFSYAELKELPSEY
jgi:NAD(P)H-flavin reductase